MKHPTMISLIAATAMALPALHATASDFGGGWKHDKNTGTLYWSLAPEPGAHQAASSHAQHPERQNSFGGGWVQDRHTNTIYYSREPEAGQARTASRGKASENLNSFGGGWVQDRHTNTLSYHPAAGGERHTAYD